MVFLGAALFFLLYISVPSEGSSLFITCKADDVRCLKKTTRKFLESTWQGIEEYDIKRIEPLIIDSLEINVGDDLATVLNFKNLNVTGLRNKEFSNLKVDTKGKTLHLKTKENLNIVGTVNVKLGNLQKSYSGPFTLKGTALGTLKYGYSFFIDHDDGIEHFIFGKETISCQILNKPQVTLGPELKQAIDEGEPLNCILEEKLLNSILCKIVEKADGIFIHNIRAATRTLSKDEVLGGI